MKLIIFGAGREGYKWYYLLRGVHEIQYFVDNSTHPEGDAFLNGFGIYSTQRLLTKDSDAVILVSSTEFAHSMCDQLRKMGYAYGRDFLLPWDFAQCKIDANLLCIIAGKEVVPAVQRLLDGRKLALIFGNCHIKFIRDAMRNSESFNSQYLLIDIPMVFEPSVSQVMLSLMENGVLDLCKLFITQYVDESNKFLPQLSTQYITSRLPPDCQVVKISNMWSSVYYPQSYDIPKDNRVIRFPDDTYSCLFRFGDKNIDELCKEGKTDEQIVEIVKDVDYYQDKFILSRADGELADFAQREDLAGIDVKMTDFVQENYKKNLLFYTWMHPTPIAIEELTNRILQYIEISEKVAFDFEPLMYGGIYSIPIYPSVIKHLGLDSKYNAMIYYPNASRFEGFNFTQHVQMYIMYRRGMMKYGK